jgi:hypothetical protein
MADLGYTVDTDIADQYKIPPPSTAESAPGRRRMLRELQSTSTSELGVPIVFENDMLDVPIYKVKTEIPKPGIKTSLLQQDSWKAAVYATFLSD